MRGLNGETALIVKNREIDRTSGEEYGYKRALLVTLDIRMEWLTRKAEYETTEHEIISLPLDFSITTSVWMPSRNDIVAGGATVEPLTHLVTFMPGFTRERASAIAALGALHLSGMQAGCAHQTPVYEDGNPNRISLENTLPCPVTGYRYGDKWLVRKLPYSFLSYVTQLCDPSQDAPEIPADMTSLLGVTR